MRNWLYMILEFFNSISTTVDVYGKLPRRYTIYFQLYLYQNYSDIIQSPLSLLKKS